MRILRTIALLALASLPAQTTLVTFSGQAYYQPTSAADTITFSQIVLGSPLLITRLDLTIGNGNNLTRPTRSLFFDLPGGPAGFGSSSPYAPSGNGLVTGIQTIDAPGDGLAGRTLAVTYTSWVTGGVFTISLDVDRLGNNLQQGSGGTNCNNCDNINGQDFIDGGAITFRLWLASAAANHVIIQPNYVEVSAAQWSRTGSNNAIVAWSTQFDVEQTGPASVPEPGALVLTAPALAALFTLRRRAAFRSHSHTQDIS